MGRSNNSKKYRENNRRQNQNQAQYRSSQSGQRNRFDNAAENFHHTGPTTSHISHRNRQQLNVTSNGSGGRRQNTFTSHQPLPYRAESDIPGYFFDPATNKYYAISADIPGQPPGSTLSELRAIRQDYERNEMKYQLERERGAGLGLMNGSSLPRLLGQLAIGGAPRADMSSTFAHIRRHVDEYRLRGIFQQPSYSFDVMDYMSSRVYSGCQFLDLRQDGRMMLGCWGVDRESHSVLIPYRVSYDAQEARKNSHRVDNDVMETDDERSVTALEGPRTGNNYGLRFVPADSIIYVNGMLIDMAVAPADSDVTCVLYATARSYMKQNCAYTSFHVHLRAIDELTPEAVRQTASAPIYNLNWPAKQPVWSCAFDTNNMRIGIGMENCATIYHLLTGSWFRVSSGGKNVISQQFTKDGDHVFLGRLNGNICTLDLRMRSNHTVGVFENSRSTSFIQQLRHQPNHILTDNFDGRMRVFDTRNGRSVIEFNDHKNSSHKLPCYIDEDERHVFAVGEDGIARGWSLATGGEPLCRLVCPKSTDSYSSSDFARILYSPRWGGVNGNAAVVLAVNDDIHVHELLL